MATHFNTCLVWIIALCFITNAMEGSNSIVDGVYSFEMPFSSKIVRKMRIYLCARDDLVYLSLTDHEPANGFGEFPIGLAIFEQKTNKRLDQQIDELHLTTYNGIILGLDQLFIDNKYEIKLDIINLKIVKIIMTIEFEDEGEIYKNKYVAYPVIISETNEPLKLSETEQRFKCWIPYDNKDENIESIITNEPKSIWKSDKLHGGIYDLDIFYSTGNGCWAWTDKNGKVKRSDGIGTAGGNNYDYKYKFNGNLLILKWFDDGDWISHETRHCHKGTSIFMIISKDTAQGTFTCKDGLTGSTIMMYRDYGNINLDCPLLRKADRNKKEL